jgi:predicted dehydrogenase
VNVIWDLAPHDVSIMDYLIGQRATTVSATGACHGGSPTENIAYVNVHFGQSLLGHIHVNWLAPAKVRRTIVGGSKRMMIYDDMEPSEKLKVYDKGVLISQDTSPESEFEWMISYRSGDMHAPKLETREALASEADNIIQSILGKDQLVVDGPAGLRVVQILDAAQQSIDQHGARVPVPGSAPVPET